jgi:hypothetical protein
VSGSNLVGVCFFGAACEGSGSDDDSGTGSGGASGGSAGSAGTGNANLPGVDPNTRLVDLTNEQAAELCDWMAGLYGGYGATHPCSTGSVQFYTSKEICVTVNLSFTCPTATVGDLETCELSKVPSGGCDFSDPSCDDIGCT